MKVERLLYFLFPGWIMEFAGKLFLNYVVGRYMYPNSDSPEAIPQYFWEQEESDITRYDSVDELAEGIVKDLIGRADVDNCTMDMGFSVIQGKPVLETNYRKPLNSSEMDQLYLKLEELMKKATLL